MSTPLRLKVDFTNKVFDGEGDPALVEKLFQEFSERVSRLTGKNAQLDVDAGQDEELQAATTIEDALRVRRRRRPIRSTTKTGETAADYTPTRLKNLDLAKLDAYCEPWVPRNHPERILLFASFLEEHLQINPCTADHIYTCYLHRKEKVPEAYLKAFRDASGDNYGYIQYNSPSDIKITIAGRNHVGQNKIKRKEGPSPRG